MNLEKDEFNQLCVRIMGYKPFDLDLHYDRLYNPYDDLNHMEDVFNKLIDEDNNVSMNYELGIKIAMRNVIEEHAKDYKKLRDNMTYEHNRYMTMRED